MTRNQCLPEDEIIRYVDSDLAPESAQRVNQHLNRCQACAARVSELQSLVKDIGAAPVHDLDVAAHVREVMRRVELPTSLERRPHAMTRLAGITAIAASFALVTQVVVSRHASMPGSWQARGSPEAESLSRDIGVQVYTLNESLRLLQSGDTVAVSTALTAGLRNLGHATAHVLLFAIDSRNAVHWITPRYTQATEDPTATELAPSTSERVLPTSVVFDDLAPGPMRIVTIVSPNVIRVSQVERLSEAELLSTSLAKYFVGAEVREIVVRVRDATQGKAQ